MAVAVDLQRVQPQAAQPIVRELPIAEGDMSSRQIQLLQLECKARHADKGSLMGGLLTVASMVTGIYTAVMISGVTGLLLGFAAYLVLANIFNGIYNGHRNREYLDAGLALNARSFREYIVLKQLDRSIETIVQVHQQYKNEHLAGQMRDIQQQA